MAEALFQDFQSDRRTTVQSHREMTVELRRLFYGKGIEMSLQPEISSLTALVADPAKAATLTPEMAEALLIGLACLKPVLLYRATGHLIGPVFHRNSKPILDYRGAWGAPVTRRRSWDVSRMTSDRQR